ncbi:MAG TPA: hypothetical protein VMT22_16980 [Terriglobales bacterium]|nr:hypothetical protein [Terriglobales bacterium]
MAEGLNFIQIHEIHSTFIGMIFFNSVFGMSYLILMPCLPAMCSPSVLKVLAFCKAPIAPGRRPLSISAR